MGTALPKWFNWWQTLVWIEYRSPEMLIGYENDDGSAYRAKGFYDKPHPYTTLDEFKKSSMAEFERRLQQALGFHEVGKFDDLPEEVRIQFQKLEHRIENLYTGRQDSLEGKFLRDDVVMIGDPDWPDSIVEEPRLDLIEKLKNGSLYALVPDPGNPSSYRQVDAVAWSSANVPDPNEIRFDRDEVLAAWPSLIPGETHSYQESTPVSAKQGITEAPNFLRRGITGIWSFRFEGGTTHHLKNMKGLRYLAELLANPGKDISSRALSSLGNPAQIDGLNKYVIEEFEDGSTIGGMGLEMIDEQSIIEYRKRISEIEEDLEEPHITPEQRDRLQSEKDQIRSYLSHSLKKNGGIRTTHDPNESARKAVGRALTSAINAISKCDHAGGRHLDQQISKGSSCRYIPPGKFTWSVTI